MNFANYFDRFFCKFILVFPIYTLSVSVPLVHLQQVDVRIRTEVNVYLQQVDVCLHTQRDIPLQTAVGVCLY